MISYIYFDLTSLLHNNQFRLEVFGDQLDKTSIRRTLLTIGPLPEGSAKLIEF